MSEITSEIPKAERKPFPRWLQIGIGWAVIIALLALSYYLVMLEMPPHLPNVTSPTDRSGDMGDLASILFGVSGIALVIFSFLVTVLAIAGWQALKNDVTETVKRSVGARIDSLEKEIRGRVLAASAIIQGRFYMQAKAHAKTDKEREEISGILEEVNDILWLSYEILKDVPGTGKLMAMNNYVYFASMEGSPKDPKFLLGKAREILRTAPEARNWEGMVTYCQVVRSVGTTMAEREGAVDILKDLLKRNDLSIRQKREANECLDSLLEIIDECLRQTSGRRLIIP